MNRKLLAVRADIAEKLSEMAKRKNLTLFSLVSEALEQLLKAENRGESLQKICENHQTISAARKAGFILIPESLWISLIEKNFKSEGKAMAQAWREAGEWLGHYFKTIDPELTPQSLAERLVRGILWSISEFTVSQGDDGTITMKCIGFRCPPTYTTLLASFLTGLMEALGYSLKSKEISKGIILLSFAEAG
ncbi:MAG: hypothetical protein DRO52_03970 [Candidatus Hecatellales archaeon]|nr:MAG: hypothetical protein DRO52_03970 [Candidatus Hecatellales archaeon]